MTEEAQPTITQALKPCPFCKSEAKHFERHNPMSKWRHSVDCEKCGASGPVEATKAEAISAWNTRTTSLAAQDGLVEALELAFDFAVKVNALLTPLKSEWQAVNMWTDYDEGVFQMRPKVTLALQAALSAIKGGKP